MGSIAEALLVYGPLGILAALAIFVAYRKDRELEETRRRCEEDRQAWQERYVCKAEEWANRYHELAKSLNEVLEALLRRSR